MTHGTGSKMIAAALAAMAGTGAAAPPAQPIIMSVVDRGTTVQVTVKGLSDQAVEAHFTLRVEGGAAGSMNRSTQGGSVWLHPGQEVTLVSLAFSAPRPGSWTAVLDVEPTGGEAYSVRRDREAIMRALSN